ncbi:hypothetical protein [Jongsikchunia kroppenstedtii]|uniref:hypothetical protein n=1 Tax=Jongsikchunia kroppenstedtii TaxID=1121721 RepID=UPI0003A003A4|nr:hypothetical protein [Jongsikchunia kroppenstedtii]
MRLAGRAQLARPVVLGGYLFGTGGYLAHRRLARALCADQERLVTTADLARFKK